MVGVDVTLIQLARAYTVFTQNGYILPIKISFFDRAGQNSNIFRIRGRNGENAR